MLVLPPTLTEREAVDTLGMLSQALQSEKDLPVVVDASGLERFDSSALAVLLECQRLALAWGRAFELRNAPAKLLSLAGLYGVDELLMPGAPATAAR